LIKHDYFHPNFDRQIPLIQRIYGRYQDPFKKRDITPMRLNSRPGKKLQPLISSEKGKFQEIKQVFLIK